MTAHVDGGIRGRDDAVARRHPACACRPDLGKRRGAPVEA